MSITALVLLGGYTPPPSKNIEYFSHDQIAGKPHSKERWKTLRERILDEINDEVWTASEMAEQIGTSYRSALFHLTNMADEGILKKKSFFAKGVFRRPNLFWK